MNKTSSKELENKIEELTILRNKKSSKLKEIFDDQTLDSRIEASENEKMKSKIPPSPRKVVKQLSSEIKELDQEIGRFKRKLFENKITILNTIDIHDSNADLLNYQIQATHILSKKAINCKKRKSLLLFMGPLGKWKIFSH